MYVSYACGILTVFRIFWMSGTVSASGVRLHEQCLRVSQQSSGSFKWSAPVSVSHVALGTDCMIHDLIVNWLLRIHVAPGTKCDFQRCRARESTQIITSSVSMRCPGRSSRVTVILSDSFTSVVSVFSALFSVLLSLHIVSSWLVLCESALHLIVTASLFAAAVFASAS